MTLPATLLFDNYARSQHERCPELYRLRIVEGYASTKTSDAVNIGIHLHHGLAEWYRTGDREAAKAKIAATWTNTESLDDWRTLHKALEVMDDYCDEYPVEAFTMLTQGDGKPFIEATFALDTGMKTIYGTPIEYGGIFDGPLAELASEIYFMDHKSTSRAEDRWMDEYHVSSQITGYIWGAQRLTGRKVAGAYINQIVLYRVGRTKFRREVTVREPVQIEEFLHDLWRQANEIEASMHTVKVDGEVISPEWRRNRSACVGKYGNCTFYDVCKLANLADRQDKLRSAYIISPWDFEKADR